MTLPEEHITHIRAVAMTDAERAEVRGRLRAFAAANPVAPGFAARAWGWPVRHGALALGLAVLVILGGTGVSAGRAHPGDFLYGFRISVNDRIETALAFSEDARIDTEMSQLQRMLDDEDSLRDSQLDVVAYAPDDEFDSNGNDELERELQKLERELADEERNLKLDGTGSDATTEPFDDGSLERELRDLEQEFRFETEFEVELES